MCISFYLFQSWSKTKKAQKQHKNMMPITTASGAESGTSRRKTQLPKCTNIPVQMITFSCLLMSLQYTQNPECTNCNLLSIFQSPPTVGGVGYWVAKADRRPREKKSSITIFLLWNIHIFPKTPSKKYVKMHVTRSKLTLKFPGYCRH